MASQVFLRSVLIVVLPIAMVPASGKIDPAQLCLDAARLAARRTDVPFDVLLAVSIVETGRNLRPWPWTVNLAGAGHWLDSAQEAEALVQEALAQGAANIDLGCFQLNYRWHGQSFRSVADMLDPVPNALYAAEFLARHHEVTEDWSLAAAAYHSATPELADRYRARFESVRASFTGTPLLPEISGRTNRFPLFVAGTDGRNGSIVPVTAGGIRLIGGP
ncbi:lytic transglycosylase domain-containing protein [Tabrizicola sp. YIM 78059]|uniref:lytic transglycosylase domain-containing protein n=1 Tax=Tabrizicola sp. YIM 78059 TaxID=2529861 RepID=UPI0010A9F2C0|nr:lytic transglycosylase domain-containing protein [Tabrizicola sp. YIM 78059]